MNRVIVALLFILALGSAKTAEAGLCDPSSSNPDEWGSGAVWANLTGGVGVRIYGSGVIHHRSGHTSACYGELNLRYWLTGGGASCSDDKSQIVTNTSTHSVGGFKDCTGTPGYCYGANGNQWWNAEQPGEFGWMEGDCSWMPKRDEDSDGYSPDDPIESGGELDGNGCDNDPFRNPSVTPTCDVGSGQDDNCDGIDDLTQCNSPILIDVAGNGFRLTDAISGVPFDLEGDGYAQHLSWTAMGSDDSWLVLDRNGNGRVDDGAEMFGNFTPQPTSPTPNGFIALAVFDGNGDRWIDGTDPIYSQLRLWNDANHDGITQPGELRPLAAVGISRLSLDYSDTARRDRNGNIFKYKARIVDTQGRDSGKFAYDVFLVALPTTGVQASEVPKRRK